MTLLPDESVDVLVLKREDNGGVNPSIKDKGISDYVNVACAVSLGTLPPPVPDGRVKPLKKLTIRHRRMIALHIQGYTAAEIARALDCHPGTVGVVLRNPTVQPILEMVYADYERELKALFPLGIRALRTGLLSTNDRIALSASDQLFRVQGRYTPDKAGERDATDTVREIIRLRHEASGTDITIARERV